MKKIIFFFLLFSTSVFSQKVEVDFALKSNYTIINFEDGLASYQLLSPLGGAAGTSQTKDYGIFTTGKMGLELGVKTKFYLFENVSIHSGLEVSLIHFNKYEELTLHTNVETLFLPEGETEIVPTIYGITQEVIRDKSGRVVVFNGNTGEAYRRGGWNQKIMHLKIPFNLGFTHPSKRWSAYGGFWYGRLIYSNYEGHDFIHQKKSNDFFSKNVFGVNAGFDVKIYKRMGITFNYSSGSTHLYTTENPLEYSKTGLLQNSSFHLISTGLVFSVF